MKRIFFIILAWFFFCGLLSAPPVDRDLSTQTRNFLYELYDYVKGLPTSTGTGTGTTTTAKESGSQVGGSDIVTFDFGSGFDLTESPDTEINVALDLTEYSGYNSSNWDTAYGWGNHASAGYLATSAIDTFAELDAIVADKTLVETTTAFGGDVTGNIGATVVGNDTHDHSAAGSTVTINAADIIDKHAGTDITADLEEEVTEGSLADSTIVSADIKNGTIVVADTAITAGRSLTWSTDDLLADAETYTDTKCLYWESPVAGDDFKSVFIFPTAATITQVFCESDQTVNMTLQEDDGTPADIETTDFVCDSTPPTQTTNFEDTAMAAGSRLDFDVTSVSGAPTWAVMCWTFTWDD